MADNITTEVLHELERAMRKFPTWPTDPLHALAVLGEEFGELTKDVLQLTYEPHKTNADNVRTEAIQTAAMALRFAASLDAYEYARGIQHAQDAAALGVPAALASSGGGEGSALSRRDGAGDHGLMVDAPTVDPQRNGCANCGGSGYVMDTNEAIDCPHCQEPIDGVQEVPRG